jgi:hypothetical protein
LLSRLQSQISRICKPQANVPLSSRIQSNSDGGWFNTVRQLSRPSDIQWLSTLCQKYLIANTV